MEMDLGEERKKFLTTRSHFCLGNPSFTLSSIKLDGKVSHLPLVLLHIEGQLPTVMHYSINPRGKGPCGGFKGSNPIDVSYGHHWIHFLFF